MSAITVFQFAQPTGGLGAQRFQVLLIDLVVERMSSACCCHSVFASATRSSKTAVEVGVEGALDDLAQHVRTQGGQRVDLGLLDSEGLAPAVGALFAFLERRRGQSEFARPGRD